MSSFFYFLKESIQGFTRNLSTTLGSIVTIFLSLLIIGVFLVGGTVINHLVSSIENEVSITAYVADDADQAQIDALMGEIRGMEGVASVDFTTKDQALENAAGLHRHRAVGPAAGGVGGRSGARHLHLPHDHRQPR